MRILRLTDIRASRIPKLIQKCSTSDDVASYINEAQERLMQKGRWWGMLRRYAICVTEGYITWPRHVASIEAASLCDSPITVRNKFFEFMEMGMGLQRKDVGDLQVLDRDESCIFIDVAGIDKTIKVTADVAEATPAPQVLLRGYLPSGRPIRTQVGGSWIEGEYVDINNAVPAISTNIFAAPGPRQVILPGNLNGIVRLYSYDPATTDEVLIATYDPDETVPWYRRSMIAGLENCCTSCGTTSDCSDVRVVVICLMEHIPVANDNDTLVIQNLEALTHTCQAMRYEEMDSATSIRKADAHMAKAIVALEKELEHHAGAGTVVPIRVEGTTWGAGNIEAIY